MKKETLIEIILGTIGGLTFAIGMCCTLLPEWNLFKEGIVIGIIGIIILLSIIPIYKKNHPQKKEKKKIDLGIIISVVLGIVGTLIMGFGMSKVMTNDTDKTHLLIGIITGVVGLLICILNYPIFSYLKSKNNEKDD